MNTGALLNSGKVVRLPLPATAITLNNAIVSADLIARWRSNGQARPVEVALQQQLEGISTIPAIGLGIYVGSSDRSLEPNYGGFFKLEYGAGALVRTRLVDLTSARLYLGVCDQVTITAARWKGATWPSYSTAAVNAGACIGEATGGEYDELTQTQQAYIAAASTPLLDFEPPEAAYSCSVAVGLFNGTYWGSAEPDFQFGIGPNGYEPVVIRPSFYQYIPPMRRTATAQSMVATTTANTVAATVATVQWYLSS